MVTGRRLADRYEIGEVVAKGGMGVVWRARDLRLGRPVAVKLVAGEALADPTVVARFDREARTVARLNHPNIVAIYDVGTDGGDSFLVMELVDGSSLATVIGDGPLPVGETLEIATQACHGLAAAHAAGVVHRDIKPANLIRTPAGVVKVCDFGIARLAHAAAQARLTGTAVAMGSTSYMAPEQINGEPVDARADLYGLGCTIYAMLTGKPPFVGESPLAIVHQHVTAAPPDLRAARPDVPAGLAALVGELLAKSPDDRPADAGVVAVRLAALRPDPPATAAAPPQPVPPPPFLPPPPSLPPPQRGPHPAEGRRRWWLWGLAGCGSAALVAIIVTSFLATKGDTPAAVTTPQPSGSPPPSAAAPRPTSRPTVQPTRTTTTAATAVPPPPTSSSSTPPARTSPADPIARLRLSIQEQVAAGALTEAAAVDLHKRVDDIAKRLDAGDRKDLPKKIKDLRTKLTDLHREGRLTQAGYDTLNRDLDPVAALAPPGPPPKP
jgi:serine/threonine protein kinase